MHSSNNWPKLSQSNLLWYFSIAIFSCIAGLALTVGGVYVAIFIFAIVVSIPFLRRVDWVLYALFALTYVIAGVAQSFFEFSQLQWLSSLFSMYLIFRGGLLSKNNSDQFKIGFIGLAFLIFLLVLVFSSIVNFIPALQWFVGVRTYLPYWGVLFVMYLGLVDEHKIKSLFQIILLVASVQWLFCLYQKLVVVPKRLTLHVGGLHGIVLLEHLEALFSGGGESGSLGVFLVVVYLLLTCFGCLQVNFKEIFFILRFCVASCNGVN
jgi:hypothetical protein